MSEYKKCPEREKIMASFGKKSNFELTDEEWDKIREHTKECSICKANNAKVEKKFFHGVEPDALQQLLKEIENSPHNDD